MIYLSYSLINHVFAQRLFIIMFIFISMVLMQQITFFNGCGMVGKMYRAHLRKTPAYIAYAQHKKLEKIKMYMYGEYICI